MLLKDMAMMQMLHWEFIISEYRWTPHVMKILKEVWRLLKMILLMLLHIDAMPFESWENSIKMKLCRHVEQLPSERESDCEVQIEVS